jgi:hypothetical protein
LQPSNAQRTNDQSHREWQLSQDGRQNRHSEVATLGSQHVEPSVTHEEDAGREREKRQQGVADEPKHRGSGHERQQQDIEANPCDLPMLGVVALGQGRPEIHRPWDQRDRGAHGQPVADAADLYGTS